MKRPITVFIPHGTSSVETDRMRSLFLAEGWDPAFSGVYAYASARCWHDGLWLIDGEIPAKIAADYETMHRARSAEDFLAGKPLFEAPSGHVRSEDRAELPADRDRLVVRARELGIRVGNTGNERLREVIAEAEAGMSGG